MGKPRTTHRDGRKFRAILNASFEKMRIPLQEKVESFLYERAWIDLSNPTNAMLLRLRKELVEIMKAGTFGRQNREEDIIVCAQAILVLRLEHDRQNPEEEG